MKKSYLQVLHTKLQAIAELTTDIANIIAALDPSAVNQQLEIDAWSFQVNDYSKLVTYLTSDPVAKKKYAKRATQSWPNYAARLTGIVGWDVEPRTLRRCFERHGEL